MGNKGQYNRAIMPRDGTLYKAGPGSGMEMCAQNSGKGILVDTMF